MEEGLRYSKTETNLSVIFKMVKNMEAIAPSAGTITNSTFNMSVNSSITRFAERES